MIVSFTLVWIYFCEQGCLVMAKQLVEYELDDGSTIFVESNFQEEGVDASDGITLIDSGGDADSSVKASKKFTEAVKSIKPAAEAVLGTLKELNTPKEIQLEFGVNFSAKAGVILASADSGFNFKVTVKWENSDG
jgi:hypothetical protein